MMEPYKFQPGSAALTQQPGGQWIAQFIATVYTDQTYSETSNTVNQDNVRVIVFEVVGEERTPLVNQGGSSAPYSRGPEKAVNLVLKRDGKDEDLIADSYP